jgi:protein involved in plasmid replication-relaxation
MNIVRALNPAKKPFILTSRLEEILRAIYFYRFMTSMDLSRLLYSPKSITYVRDILSSLAGGEDFKNGQFLYRFRLPSFSSGGGVRIFTLGSKGRDFLANELGLPVDWYYRPSKTKYLSYSQVQHNLLLTRLLVAAHAWAAKQPDFELVKTRICYELAKTPATLEVTREGKTEKLKVIPDAWILVELLNNGEHKYYFPITLEVDRGTEFKDKFIRHLRSRIEFIRSGAYKKMFQTDAVLIAYVTTGERPEYRETRRATMCAYTREVLSDLHMENWSHIFRFASVVFDELYTTPMFDEPVWYRPDSPTPVPLLTHER